MMEGSPWSHRRGVYADRWRQTPGALFSVVCVFAYWFAMLHVFRLLPPPLSTALQLHAVLRHRSPLGRLIPLSMAAGLLIDVWFL